MNDSTFIKSVLKNIQIPIWIVLFITLFQLVIIPGINSSNSILNLLSVIFGILLLISIATFVNTKFMKKLDTNGVSTSFDGTKTFSVVSNDSKREVELKAGPNWEVDIDKTEEQINIKLSKSKN